MLGLILCRGLSFRGPGAYNRQLAFDQQTIDDQLKATETHIKLVDYMEKLGHEIHVAFDTVACDHTKLIFDAFGERIKFYNVKNVFDANVHFSLHRAVRFIETPMCIFEYDFLLILRNDMFLKDEFIEKFNPYDDKIMFPSLQWHQARKTPNGNPRINDCMFFIPRKYFQLIYHFPSEVGFDHHDILDNWLEIQPTIPYDFYVRGFHNADTATEKHPLYYLINRPEAEEIGSPDLKYPDDF